MVQTQQIITGLLIVSTVRLLKDRVYWSSWKPQFYRLIPLCVKKIYNIELGSRITPSRKYLMSINNRCLSNFMHIHVFIVCTVGMAVIGIEWFLFMNVSTFNVSSCNVRGIVFNC